MLGRTRELFFEVRLWDANHFVDAILETYGRLLDDIKAELPIKRVWTRALEQD